jgi:hypothetical protein
VIKKRSKEKEVPSQVKEPHSRLSNTLLSKFPVNLLAVNRGFSDEPHLKHERDAWEKLTSRTEKSKQPHVIILEAGPRMLSHGPTDPLAKAQ